MPFKGPWQFALKGITSNQPDPFLEAFCRSLGSADFVAENTVETVRLLVVSREPLVLRHLWSLGESNAWHLETAGSGWEAMERLQSDVAPHLLLLDLPCGDDDSLLILRWLRRLRPDLPIILSLIHI